MVRSGAVLVDIRMENEYRNSGHFRGCINIPLYLLRLKIGTLDPAKKYIMYCDTGHRSSAAAFIMNEHGLEAYVLEGGACGAFPWRGQPGGIAPHTAIPSISNDTKFISQYITHKIAITVQNRD